MTSYVKIYEKKELDISIGDPRENRMAFIYMDGSHTDRTSGNKVEDLGGAYMLEEKLTSMQLLVGGAANKSLNQYAQIVCKGYLERNPKCVFTNVEVGGDSDSLPEIW